MAVGDAGAFSVETPTPRGAVAPSAETQTRRVVAEPSVATRTRVVMVVIGRGTHAGLLDAPCAHALPHGPGVPVGPCTVGGQRRIGHDRGRDVGLPGVESGAPPAGMVTPGHVQDGPADQRAGAAHMTRGRAAGDARIVGAGKGTGPHVAHVLHVTVVAGTTQRIAGVARNLDGRASLGDPGERNGQVAPTDTRSHYAAPHTLALARASLGTPVPGEERVSRRKGWQSGRWNALGVVSAPDDGAGSVVVAATNAGAEAGTRVAERRGRMGSTLQAGATEDVEPAHEAAEARIAGVPARGGTHCHCHLPLRVQRAPASMHVGRTPSTQSRPCPSRAGGGQQPCLACRGTEHAASESRRRSRRRPGLRRPTRTWSVRLLSKYTKPILTRFHPCLPHTSQRSSHEPSFGVLEPFFAGVPLRVSA